MAMWAMLLNDSKHKGYSSYNKIMYLLESIQLDDLQNDFYKLVQESERLM